MSNKVITVKTSGRRTRPGDPKVVPIQLTFEITKDGELVDITAQDRRGTSFDVSIDLSQRDNKPICCCPNKKRKKYDCFELEPGERCPCKRKKPHPKPKR